MSRPSARTVSVGGSGHQTHGIRLRPKLCGWGVPQPDGRAVPQDAPERESSPGGSTANAQVQVATQTTGSWVCAVVVPPAGPSRAVLERTLMPTSGRAPLRPQGRGRDRCESGGDSSLLDTHTVSRSGLCAAEARGSRHQRTNPDGCRYALVALEHVWLHSTRLRPPLVSRCREMPRVRVPVVPVLLLLHPDSAVLVRRQLVRRLVQWRLVRRRRVASPARRGIRVVQPRRVAHDGAPRPERRGGGPDPP